MCFSDGSEYFLHGRSIRVSVALNGCVSTVGYINAGVPQGSILGPSLFLIFINDLTEAVTNNISLFADDTTLSAVVPNTKLRKLIADSLNADLKDIETWASKWLVKFNAKKTQLLHISRKLSTDSSDVCFCSETLEPAESIKLLGVHIFKNLDWDIHVDKVAKTAGRSLGVLRKASKLLDAAGLATLYKTKVRSVMEYCGPLWQGAPKTVLMKLDTIQRKACRFLGAERDACTKFNIDSLQHRRTVSGLCQIHRMVSGIAPSIVCELLPHYDVKVRNSRLTSNSHHLQLTVKRSRTVSHQNSFISCFSRWWNKTPIDCIYDRSGDLASTQMFKVSINCW